LSSFLEDSRFQIVAETMVDGLIVSDGAGAILYVNPACCRLFGYPAGDLIGANVSHLMPAAIASVHDSYMTRHREMRVSRIIGIGRELTGKRADGSTFPMYLSVGEADSADGPMFVGIIYDLSDKKRAEETILHHQKLDAIGQLSGGVAHDFNNILSVIGGNLEMIARLDLPPAARRAIARAQEATHRASRITQRLLAFARKQPLLPQVLDLNRVLLDIVEMLRRSLGEAIEVRMKLADDLPMVEADIDQFETAILNLAVNARDAMPQGGVLTVETEAVRVNGHGPPSPVLEPGWHVRVSVADTGAGMTPEVMARAMEPFFTTKEVGAGTGLGLSMVYGFVKQLGGQVALESEPGRGTRIDLWFPVAQGAAPDRKADASPDLKRGKGELILVVEDDPDVRLVTVAALESLGYRVETAGDGASALKRLAETADVALALIDIVMPGGMDGHQLAAEIRLRHPGVRRLLTSGYSPRLAEGEGADGVPFLPKPASRERLGAAVRAALDAPE
jgi:PAS domain S-box-containing protein